MNIKLILLALLVALAQILTACASGSLFAAPTATAQPTPTHDPLSAAKVVQAFWDAMEAGDLETAMAYIDDNVECRGYCHFTGKLTLKTYLQGYLDAGFSTQISDVKNVGSIVTYSWEAYRNGLFQERSQESMQVEDGKIIFWENNHH